MEKIVTLIVFYKITLYFPYSQDVQWLNRLHEGCLSEISRQLGCRFDTSSLDHQYVSTNEHPGSPKPALRPTSYEDRTV